MGSEREVERALGVNASVFERLDTLRKARARAHQRGGAVPQQELLLPLPALEPGALLEEQRAPLLVLRRSARAHGENRVRFATRTLAREHVPFELVQGDALGFGRREARARAHVDHAVSGRSHAAELGS